jgi:hypothetical protein
MQMKLEFYVYAKQVNFFNQRKNKKNSCLYTKLALFVLGNRQNDEFLPSIILLGWCDKIRTYNNRCLLQ